LNPFSQYRSRAPPSLPLSTSYSERYPSRYGPVRHGIDRYERGHGRPYSEPYERRSMPASRDDYYYRRPYEPYSRRPDR